MEKSFIIVKFVFIYLSVVNSDPRDYVNYKGEFAQIGYDKNGVNTTTKGSSQGKSYFNVSQHSIDLRSDDEVSLQELISGFTSTLQNFFEHQKRVKAQNLYNASHDVGNKTKILVSAFDLHDLIRIADKMNESLTTESDYTNLSKDITPSPSGEVVISFSGSENTVAPVASAVKDRYPKSIFSQSFFNDILSQKVPIYLENDETDNTTSTKMDSISTNEKQNSAVTDIFSNGPILFTTSVNGTTLEELKRNYEHNILKKLEGMKDGTLYESIENETTSTSTEKPIGITEDVYLESLFDGSDFVSVPASEDTVMLTDNLTQSFETGINTITTFNMKGQATINVLSNEEPAQEISKEISIEYGPFATVQPEEHLTQTLKQPDSVKTVYLSALFSTTTESIKKSNSETKSYILTTKSNDSPVRGSSQNTMSAHSAIQRTVKASMETSTKTTPELDSTTVLSTTSVSTPNTTTRINTPEVTNNTECKKDKTPSNIDIKNDMKFLKVDQILILLPVMAQKPNGTNISNETKNATKSNLANNPMNEQLKKQTELKYVFDKKEILKRDKENEVYEDIDDFLNDNSTADYLGIDYVDYYKDVVLDDVVVTTVETGEPDLELVKNEVEHNILQYALQSSDSNSNNQYARSVHDCHGNATTMADAVFPWIVTIFHKNGNTDQFEYFCDGVLLNENAVLTSARCVSSSGAIADPGQLIVILGKRNLKIMHEHEIVVRVSKLIVHPNFHEPSSDGFVEDDLAIVILDSIVPMSSSIRAACLDCPDCGGVEQAATTGWALTGELTPIFFAKEEKEFDITSKKVEGTYGLDVSVCPSHGGIYFVQLQGAWYVRGVSASNPNDQGLCIIRTLDYTSLRTYMDWISGVIIKAD